MKVVRLRRNSKHQNSFEFFDLKDVIGISFNKNEESLFLELEHKKKGVLKYKTHIGSIEDIQILNLRWEKFLTSDAIFFDLAWFEPLLEII